MNLDALFAEIYSFLSGGLKEKKILKEIWNVEPLFYIQQALCHRAYQNCLHYKQLLSVYAFLYFYRIRIKIIISSVCTSFSFSSSSKQNMTCFEVVMIRLRTQWTVSFGSLWLLNLWLVSCCLSVFFPPYLFYIISLHNIIKYNSVRLVFYFPTGQWQLYLRSLLANMKSIFCYT